MCIRDSDIPETIGKKKFADGNSGAACAVYNHAAVLPGFARHLQGIDNTSENDDCSSMLVIMKYGDVQEFLQAFLNFKTARGGNVFQVNPSESRSDTHNRLNDLVRILCVQADRKGVDAAEFFEEDSFSLHDRHGSQRADIAKSKDCAAIGNNGLSLLHISAMSARM